MANELTIPYNVAGATLYAHLWNGVGQVYRYGSTNNFEAYATANIAEYKLALNQKGTASMVYGATMPTTNVPVGMYGLQVRVQSGGSPAEADAIIYAEDAIYWTGTAWQYLGLPQTGDAYAVANSRLPAALGADGFIKASLFGAMGTALTETAGQISAAIVKFFNKAAPTGTINSLPDAVAGASGGLPTTNGAKLSQTADLTAGQTVAATVAGSVGSVAAGGITAASFATDSIAAAAVKADAVTKIQAGLSTYAGGAVASVTGNVGGKVLGGGVGSITGVGALVDKTGYALTSGEHTAISGTDVPAALTSQGYTTARAGYLDTLNGLVAAIWNAATSGMTTAGSIGKKLVDWVVGKLLTYDTGQDPATLVLDVSAASHNTAGSIGQKINSAGGAADPLTNAVPGGYGAGTAGYVLGTNLNATISSRAATGAQMDLIDVPNATALNEIRAALNQAVIPDSVAADGSRGSMEQTILQIWRFMSENALVGTVWTVNKEDGTTPCMVLTLNDATNPTAVTRTA